MKKIKALLDAEVLKRNQTSELSYDKPDPLLIASRHKDIYISIACALFAYGRADAIVKFLDSIDFTIIDTSEDEIRAYFKEHYYRFQSREDVQEFFITLSRAKKDTLHVEEIIYEAYKQESSVIDGINALIEYLYTLNSYSSKGYRFLLGSPVYKTKGASALKRWMVRDDSLDLGLFSKIDKKDLIIPLDTHTQKVSLKLGFLKRKIYDLEAAIELSKTLKDFDKYDPIKYDFAIYRLGPTRLIHSNK